MAFTVMPPDPHDVHYNGVYGGFPLRGTVRRVLPANGAAGQSITVFYEHDLESMMRRPRIQVPEGTFEPRKELILTPVADDGDDVLFFKLNSLTHSCAEAIFFFILSLIYSPTLS
jgi:hypothetical protein